MEKKDMIYDAAIYVRLSKEDGEKMESNSIINQKAFIRDFLKSKPEIRIVSEKADDGYSGVNFDRPGFQEMLSEIKSGVVNCVVVKDLSRFARNYIDAGQYIEHYFPFMGVRFIAITDNYDSVEKGNSSNQIMVPFKNLMNDFYCGDISRKTRSNLETKRKKGDYLSAFAAYGYEKDKENKNKIVIDETAAEVVRRIFREKLHGKNHHAIAAELNAEGILSPYEYKRFLGFKMNHNFKSNETALWHEKTILDFLRNPIYIGTLEQGKVTTINYKLRTQIKKEKEDWIVLENNHESIISKEVFETVQRCLASDTRTAPGQKKVYPFSGLLFCADCGRNHTRTIANSKRENKHVYYVCSGYKQEQQCTPHRMNEKLLTDSVFISIKLMINCVFKKEEFIQEKQSLQWFVEQQNNILSMELKRYETMLTVLQQSFEKGIIDIQEYEEMQEMYIKKCSSIHKSFALIHKKQEMFHTTQNAFGQFSRYMVVTFIEHILIYEKKRVWIQFSFQDIFQKEMEL